MIAPAILPLVRRAIVDLLADVGGEHNDDVLAVLLQRLGHPLARRDVREQLLWLGEQGLATIEQLGPYVVARATADARDLAAGRLSVTGVDRHKSGE